MPEADRWRGLLTTGAWCAIAGVVLVVVQMALFTVAPPPDSTAEVYERLIDNPLLGMLSLDLLYIVSNVLALLVYVALGVTLWHVSRSAVTVALTLCVVGIATYMASTRAVEMLSLSRLYADADDAERARLLTTGDGMLAGWQGTAFDVYYVLGATALLILSVLMLRSGIYGRATARWGLASGVLMAIPTNVGIVGLVFAIASLAPWSVFSVLVARRLLRMAHDTDPDAAGADGKS